eukprot:gene2014-2624_t
MENLFDIVIIGSGPGGYTAAIRAAQLGAKPESIVIIGGGVIGVEMASIFARIGVKITIIEYAESLIPTMDRELGKELQK